MGGNKRFVPYFQSLAVQDIPLAGAAAKIRRYYMVSSVLRNPTDLEQPVRAVDLAQVGRNETQQVVAEMPAAEHGKKNSAGYSNYGHNQDPGHGVRVPVDIPQQVELHDILLVPRKPVEIFLYLIQPSGKSGL
jgi:hypothetical protein